MDLFLVYLCCFGVGLLFAILSAVFSQSGGSDGHAEAPGHGEAPGGIDHADMPGVSALSPTSLATFVTAFGGFGMIFSRIDATKSPWISAPLAALGGMLTALAVLLLFRAVFAHTQSSSESRVDNLAGRTGHVLTPIPEHGVGEIAYVDGGVRYTAPARSDTGAAISGGSSVVITRIAGSQFFVRPA